MLQQEVQEHSRDTSRLWDNWLRDQENRQCPPYSSSSRKWWGKNREERADQYLAPGLGSLKNLGFFLIPGCFTQYQACWWDRVHLSQRGKRIFAQELVMAAECWIKWQMKFPVNKCKCTQEEKNPLLCLYSDGAELATTILEQDLTGHSD